MTQNGQAKSKRSDELGFRELLTDHLMRDQGGSQY
jgi:hypothetical protein